MKINKNKIFLEASFTRNDIQKTDKAIKKLFKKNKKIEIDLSKVNNFDNLTLSFLKKIKNEKKIDLVLSNVVKKELDNFCNAVDYNEDTANKLTGFEKTVVKFNDFIDHLIFFIILAADIFYYSARAVFSSKGRKKGSVFEQIFLMGNNAVPIVALLSFLIGLVLSLQSAAQLKQFGANIYLVDLIVIAMITEMGPMITAVIVAGRSGSAIAAEIATMKITEELDALKVMALNPLKYVVSPKMLAMTISLPILTMLSNLIGILGGFVIAVLYLDLSPGIFFSRAIQVMSISFWRQSVLKSILFSWLIVIIGCHFGFTVKGGAEGVGKATTASVVASIFAVIMTDAVLSLIFYFEF